MSSFTICAWSWPSFSFHPSEQNTRIPLKHISSWKHVAATDGAGEVGVGLNVTWSHSPSTIGSLMRQEKLENYFFPSTQGSTSSPNCSCPSLHYVWQGRPCHSLPSCSQPPQLALKPVQVFCELPIPATALYTTRATMQGFCLQILALMNSLIILLHGPAEPSGC